MLDKMIHWNTYHELGITCDLLWELAEDMMECVGEEVILDEIPEWEE